MHDKYVLDDDGNPLPIDDGLIWGHWFETHKRHVADTRLPGGVRVSTIFLGIDHNFCGGPPVLWETTVFGGPHDQEMRRYHSRAEAETGHQEMVEMCSQPAAQR